MRRQLKQLAVALAFITTLGTALSAAPIKIDEQYITVTGLDVSGCVWTYLSVYRSGGGTVLFYDVQNICTSDPLGQTVARGFGPIPNAALSTTKSRATLAVTVANTSTFTAEGVVGSISLTLVRNGFSLHTFSGQERLEFNGVLIRSHGTRSEYSASAEGGVLGYTQNGAIGLLGSSQDLYIEVVPK
jgi:hypothetical protein